MEIITQDGEVIEDVQALVPTSSMAVQLQKAEIDQQISTARAYPRSLKRVQSAIMSMATLDEESAEECMYALPRGGKPIKGPSVRFAEILKQSFGNCRAAARVVHVDRHEMYVEAEGVFHDLETNSMTTTRVRRRISGKNGKVFNEDMIIVTGNAACAIAKRNAILDGIPKPLWRRAYETVQAAITGDVTTLSENREKAFKALAAFGAKPEQIFQALGVEGIEDIGVDHIATLRGMYSALKNGEATVEEMFVGTVKAVSDHQKVANPLSDDTGGQGSAVMAEPSETAALTNEPAIQNNQTPDALSSGLVDAQSPSASDQGSGDTANADPNHSADEADQSEDGIAPGSATTETPALSSDANSARQECVDKLMGLATDKVNFPDIGDRIDMLGQSAQLFADNLGDDVVRPIFNRCREVIEGKLSEANARQMLAGA